MRFARVQLAFTVFAIPACVLIAAILFVALLPQEARATQTGQTAASATGWHEVSLPSRPVHIAINGTTLWVCGADEMVVKSEDGGLTWAVKHAKPDGDVLLTLSFAGEKTIFASGTNGIMLRSDDGGETWKSWASGLQTVINMSFGDEARGIRQTKTAVETTSDGGQTWKTVLDRDLKKYPEVLGIASLDGTHYSILAQRALGKSILFATENGGATWKQAQYQKLWWLKSMITSGGEYWAFGQALSDGRDPTAYAGNLFVHSSDGMTWSREVQARGFPDDCKMAGCIENDGVINTVYDPVPNNIYFPTGKPLTSEWAIAEGNICLISRDVRCASASKTNEPPPRLNRGVEFFNTRLDSPVDGCVACPLYSFPVKKGLLEPITFAGEVKGPKTTVKLPPMAMLSLHADVTVSYRLQKNGTTKDVQIAGTKLEQIADAVRADVESWLFEPSSSGDLDKTHTLQLQAGCAALPSDEDANCSAGLPPDPSKYPRVN